MRVITCYQGQLQVAAAPAPSRAEAGVAGDLALSHLERGYVHELLATDCMPRLVAAWLSAALASADAVVWCEAAGEPYPPALAAAGILPRRVYMVRPRTQAEAVWATTEALRCRGVGATIAMPERLTAVEARRLQLAAERGGGIGLLLRRLDGSPHAARTRWLVRPALGDPLTQRWRLRLIHGHGRPSDQDVLLEVNRETHHVRAADVVADRSREATPTRTAG